MDHDETPINASSPRARQALESARWPFEQAAWVLRRRVIWPLQDWFGTLDGSARLGLAGGATLAVGMVVLALVALGGSGSSQPAAAEVAVVTTPPAKTATVAPAPEPEEEAETLHGAPPVFKSGEKPSDAGIKGSSQAVAPDSSEATGSATTSSSAATARISSNPSAETASAPNEAAVIPGKPAGPQALAVARRFSKAFVVYETGGEEAPVKKEFAATSTPALAKALLRRPPRLPADVKVPKAKVVTVVPGPSREGVYTVSVSLLRVGVTSELRLEMEKRKKDGWRVTNVLG